MHTTYYKNGNVIEHKASKELKSNVFIFVILFVCGLVVVSQMLGGVR